MFLINTSSRLLLSWRFPSGIHDNCRNRMLGQFSILNLMTSKGNTSPVIHNQNGWLRITQSVLLSQLEGAKLRKDSTDLLFNPWLITGKNITPGQWLFKEKTYKLSTTSPGSGKPFHFIFIYTSPFSLKGPKMAQKIKTDNIKSLKIQYKITILKRN